MTSNKTTQAVAEMLRMAVNPNDKGCILGHKQTAKAIADKYLRMEQSASRFLHPGTFFLQEACLYKRRTGCLDLNGVNGECINCEAIRHIQEALSFDPIAKDISELLNDSINIVAEKGIWKDVPDAAKHIREKRGGYGLDCSRCGTSRVHPESLSCPYEQ